jgi:hypothetical protein
MRRSRVEEPEPVQSLPTHTHDCTNCVYLCSTRVTEFVAGGHPDEGDLTDWWICPPNDTHSGTIIGRFGSEGSQYWSMPLVMLREAASHSRVAAEALNVCDILMVREPERVARYGLYAVTQR